MTDDHSDPIPRRLPRRYRLEPCLNGWVVVVTEGADRVLGRYVFTSTATLLMYLSANLENIK